MAWSMRMQRRAMAGCIALALGIWGKRADADMIVAGSEYSDESEPHFEDISGRQFGLGTAHMYLRYAHARNEKYSGGVSDLFTGGLSTRAIYGKRFGFGTGLGFELGGSHSAGFSAGVDFYPAGFAIAFGPTGYFGTFFGIGINGVAARIPFAFSMPAEMRFEFDLTHLARISALWAIAWTPLEEPRQNASTLIPFADETLFALGARFGKTFSKYGANMGRGYFLRLERREQARTVWLGFSFGIEIDYAQ